MKVTSLFTTAIAAIGLAASIPLPPAFGQFTILSDQRTVAARAEIDYVYFGTELIHVNSVDEDTRVAEWLSPFDVTVQAHARDPNVPNWTPIAAEARQTSTLSASEIYLAGGVGEAIGTSRLSSGSASIADVTFSVAAPTIVQIQYERFDPGRLGEPVPQSVAGAATISIIGPGVQINVADKTGFTEAYCLARGYPNCVPDTIIGEHALTLAPGEYRIFADAAVAGGGMSEVPHRGPVSFMVHITAQPIPEPATWALALCATALLGRWITTKSRAV